MWREFGVTRLAGWAERAVRGAGRGIIISSSNPRKARQRRRGRPRLSDGRRAFVYVLVHRCASWEASSQAEDGGNEMVTRE